MPKAPNRAQIQVASRFLLLGRVRIVRDSNLVDTVSSADW